MADRSGQQFGNYRLLRLLGRGGFAEVYLGQHVRLASQQAAIKILSTRLNEADIRAFEQEAETIASLIHPHIVRVLDFDVLDGIPFLVMDYAPSGSLRQRHSSREQVPLSTVMMYMQQIADGLQYAHDQKRIHRDIKPDNMLIGRRGEILLSDFGIATIAHSTTSQSAQAAIGTIPYMAPEQMQEHPRPASDQYALAITVYEWLVGERPFNGTFTEIAVKHAMMPPPPLRTKRPELSPEIEQVVLTALAKDPKARFGSVQAFATALKEANVAPPSSQATIFPSASTAQNPLPPTAPVRLASGEVVAAASAITPPTPPTTQPDPWPITEVATSTLPGPQTIAPIPISTKKKPENQRMSRRAVIITGAVGVAMAGGGVVWSAFQHQPSSSLAFITSSQTSITSTQIGTLLYTYRGHTGFVNAVAWSPDGKRIASGSVDKMVQVWDATTGRNIYTYRGHTGAVNAVAWSPDGKHIASGSDDKTVQVWYVTASWDVYTYSGHTALVTAVAWSLDGKHIASGSNDKTVQVWDVTTGGNVYTYQGHTGSVRAVAWSPDGKRIASGGDDKTVQVWDATTGRNIYTYRGHAGLVNAVAWSPDGKRIASGSNDKTVQVWSAG